jgi:hypothetical protein
MSAMKYPLLTGFCGGLVIFAGCTYLGYRGSQIATYRMLKPMSFRSLNQRGEERLRSDLLALQAAEFSQFAKDAPPDLQKAAERLEGIRGNQSADAQSVLDMHIAACYVEAARLERESGNSSAASHHQQAAEDILHSLGWKDTSNEAMADLTRGKLWWKEKP